MHWELLFEGLFRFDTKVFSWYWTRRSVSLRAWPSLAIPVWDVPMRFHGFGALSSAGAAGCTLPCDEEEVAAVSPLGCSDASEWNWRWDHGGDRIVIAQDLNSFCHTSFCAFQLSWWLRSGSSTRGRGRSNRRPRTSQRRSGKDWTFWSSRLRLDGAFCYKWPHLWYLGILLCKSSAKFKCFNAL